MLFERTQNINHVSIKEKKEMDINGKMAGKNVVSEALAASRKYETQNEIDKNE